MHRLLLLEDEPDLQEELADFLRARGWQVLAASTIAEAEALSGQAAMAVCDVMLPDGSGFDFAARLRARSAGCGIVMLTARGATQDVVAGLQGGADHYLVKPVNLLQLDATLQALSRRVGLANWRLERVSRGLCAPGLPPFELSAGEWSLLEVLAAAGGVPVSRRAIVEAQGHDWLDYDQRRLDTQVSRLRQRWREHAGGELPLKTVHGAGYALTVSVVLC